MKPIDLYACNIRLGEVPHIAGVLIDTDVLSIRKETLTTMDVVELRVDMFEKTSIEHVEAVFRFARDNFNKPLIGTVRDVREGGRKEFADRAELYRTIIPYCDLVDIEINAGDIFDEVKAVCRAGNKALIGSYHNFESAPDNGFLEDIVSKGKTRGVDIVKIAVTAVDPDDAARLAVFTYANRDKGLIAFCMGDKGLSSRVFTPLFGSLLTYGYINHPAAPGQLSTSELMYIFRRLKVR